MTNKNDLPTTETATVYRAAGRRWFSKAAACRAAARQKIKSRCWCEPTEWFGPSSMDCTPGQVCEYHDDADRLERIIVRLARIYRKATK